MRYLILFLVLFVASCQPKSLPTQTDYQESGATIKLSHETTKDELQEIKEQLMSRYAIKVDYSKTTFLKENTIRDLSLVIENTDQGGGTLNVPLARLQYGYYGLVIDKSNNGFYLQKTGGMN